MLAVHNPIVFIVDVYYSGGKPTFLSVDLIDKEAVVLATFRAIEYNNNTDNSIVTYHFRADDVLKAYMLDFDDFHHAYNELVFVENITKQFTLKFYNGASFIETEITAIHAARQFGQDPCLIDIQNNENLLFHAAIGMPVYIYIYNNSDSNNISVNKVAGVDDYCLDFDDTVFLDYNDYLFRAK
ncbi:MAG: hypothetical protein OEL54_03035 [Flavobacteriaceae bacterium]|nr:hypothetical protein [Flavobacteriaceae bacterium]